MPDAISMALHFANGDAFFAGVLLLVLGIAASVLFERPWTRIVARTSILLGSVLIALSATPLPNWAYCAWLLALVWFLAARMRVSGKPTRVVALAASCALIITLAAAGRELSYEITASVEVPAAGRILVLGDSITAGLNDDVIKWPAIYAGESGPEVRDLSEPGATVESVTRQVEAEDAAGLKVDVAIVEIGGNDMLEKEDVAKFERDLDHLLEVLSRISGRIVLLELPLPPFYNGYGRAQRRLAARFDAILVPKRVFARVLGAGGATLDGLHLSQKGHEMMAGEMRRIVTPR